MELRLLIEMKLIQEEKLEKEAKRIAKINNQKNSNSSQQYEGIAPHLRGLP